MFVKLLIEHHSEFLRLKGGCSGSSESTHVIMPHCWKSHALAHRVFVQAIAKKRKTLVVLASVCPLVLWRVDI